MCIVSLFFFFKKKAAYELRIGDWSSDVCSSDPQDAVVVEIEDLFEQPLDGLSQAVLLDLPPALEVGIEAQNEELDDTARQRGVLRQHVLHIGLAEQDPDLTQIFGEGAQRHHLAPLQAGAQHQPADRKSVV